MKAVVLFFGVVMCCILPTATAGQESSAAAGNAERGREFFSTYKCYACHGHSGQTGSPRIVPMTRSEGAFIRFLRAPTGAMPAYADAPEAALADLYAYVRSIEPDSMPVEEIPLLNELLEEVR